jgi:NAD(P)-binding Rossmann-like domain
VGQGLRLSSSPQGAYRDLWTMSRLQYISVVGIAYWFWIVAASNVIKTKVAVLGGGMAGVIAARTLNEQGVHDFVIVEARTELGLPSNVSSRNPSTKLVLQLEIEQVAVCRISRWEMVLM